MASLAKVFLIGNLTRDPESIPNADGCKFGIAVNEKYTKKDGNKVEEVSFFDIVAWGQTAKVCMEYLKKGKLIHIEGRIKQERWKDKESGNDRSKHVVHADRVTFIGGRDDSGSQPSTEKPASVPAGGVPSADDGVSFDDIPFAFLITCIGASAMAILGA